MAGLRAAIELAEAGTVLVVAKDSLRESSSEYAQGGIAVALSDDDEVELHEQDTLYAGDGLCDRAAVRTLVEEGPAAIQELIEWGAEFDREGNKLAFTREGAHSRNRILHAHGDSTGREIARTLYQQGVLAAQRDVSQLCGYHGTAGGRRCDGRDDLGREGGERVSDSGARGAAGYRRAGARVFEYDQSRGRDRRWCGHGVPGRRGDRRYRVRAVPSDGAAVEGAPRFLLSEALRGEGASAAKCARRAIHGALPSAEGAGAARRGGAGDCDRDDDALVCRTFFWTCRIAGESFIRERFPRIYETCLRYGVNIASGPAPVAPAAHYAMGGVRTDLDGRTNIARLFAAGEAACTGVHGANRLASNSLLEGVVFGIRAGRAMRERVGDRPGASRGGKERRIGTGGCVAGEIQRIAWEKCGIVRSAEGLREAVTQLEALAPESPEELNARQVALLIARCALAREESRGAHFRSDYPRNAR